MADEKQDFQDYQFARWKASGKPIDEYLKDSGLGAKGYVYDKDAGKFDHPDSYLSKVNPDSIPSIADRNFARGAQGLDKIAQGGRPDTITSSRQIGQVGPGGSPVVASTADRIARVDPNSGQLERVQNPSAIQVRVNAFRNYGTGVTPDAEWNRQFPTSQTSVQPINFQPAVAAARQVQQDRSDYYSSAPGPGIARYIGLPSVSSAPAIRGVVNPPSTTPGGYTEPPVSPGRANYWLNQALSGSLALPQDRAAVRAAAASPNKEDRDAIWQRRRY